jgi:hypothetical protein
VIVSEVIELCGFVGWIPSEAIVLREYVGKGSYMGMYVGMYMGMYMVYLYSEQRNAHPDDLIAS